MDILQSVVRAKYDFSVLFYEYFNPTGLCAECGTGGTPACCDNFNFTSQCLHIVESCDTAFRFIQRPYGALVETAPDRGYDDYTRSHTNREHEVFNEGKGGFLSLENPHTRANLTAWNVSARKTCITLKVIPSSWNVHFMKANILTLHSNCFFREGYSYT